MPTVPQIIKYHRQWRQGESKPSWGQLGLVISLIASLIIVAFVIGISWYYFDLTRNLPTIDTLTALLQPPSGSFLEPTRLVDRTGQHVIMILQNPAAEGRQYLYVGEEEAMGQAQVSQSLIDATVAAVDPSFWKESGYSLDGITAGTHATLAQQLVLNMLLSDEPPSVVRNLRERLLAMQATAQFGRQKILEWYLNSVQYGDFVYGADAAARVYFDQSATQLSIAQAAMLTAIAGSSGINPWQAGQLLRDRQVQVILEMQQYGMINADQAQAALRENIQLQPQQELISLAPALTHLALQQIDPEISLQSLSRGGYDIVTTLDYDFQLQAECAAQAQLGLIKGIRSQVEAANGSPCKAASYLPALQPGTDQVPKNPAASAIILEPQSGEILAWAGDDPGSLTSALPPAHPAGSILSPFLYLTAFSQGMSPATLLWDLPQPDDPTFSDVPLASFHGPVRLRIAIINDYSGAAADALRQIGIKNLWQTVSSFGFQTANSGSSEEPSLKDLYSQPVSLLDTVRAYAVLANQGIMAGQFMIENTGNKVPGKLVPISVRSVEGRDGKALLDWSEPHLRPIVSQQLAYLTTNVLSDQQAHTSNMGNQDSFDFDRPVAIKASVSLDGRNSWAVGYIPQLVAGVWLGDSTDEMGGSSSDAVTGLWHALIEYASSALPVQDFPVPEDISHVQVCDPSGLLVSPLCPVAVNEVFLQGNEPTVQDNLYQQYSIDRKTNLLATIFTPTALEEKKIFIVLPPPAKDWANAAGIATPPDTYDDITGSSMVSPVVQITRPGMSEHVSGQIELLGSAAGANFSYYRLQVGQGFNPRLWLQIGQDIQQPVQDGRLGLWDTKGLDGIYIVQLMVVRQDLRVERANLQVTVDNTPPQVKIIAPLQNEQFNYRPGESLVLQANVTDDHGSQRIEFYIDGNLLSTLYDAPFLIAWPVQLGMHTLQVKAVDLAGNQAQISSQFSIIK